MNNAGTLDNIMEMLIADWNDKGKPDEFKARYSAGENLHFQGQVEPYFPDDGQDYEQPDGWELKIYFVHRAGGDPNADEVERSAALCHRVIERRETPDAG